MEVYLFSNKPYDFQIELDGSHLVGRLVQLLSVPTAKNPRWLLTFDFDPHKDEKIRERSFGSLAHSAHKEYEEEEQEPEPATPSTSTSSAQTSIARTGTGTRPLPSTAIRRGSGGDSKTSNMSSEGETGDETKGSKKAGKKNVQFHEDSIASSDVDSETSGRPRSARDRVSAREARSRRRQAKIDEPGEGEILDGGKRMLPQEPISSKMAKRHHSGDGDGEVVKVKLLTGTLYLYRGEQRRAEFIRRV